MLYVFIKMFGFACTRAAFIGDSCGLLQCSCILLNLLFGVPAPSFQKLFKQWPRGRQRARYSLFITVIDKTKAGERPTRRCPLPGTGTLRRINALVRIDC